VIKVTADTNIYISAFNFGGKPLALLELARAGQIELAVSNAILTEVSRILHNKFNWTREDVHDAVDLIVGFANYVHPYEKVDAVPTDPDDNRVLECAMKAGSSVIVTGDTDLLTLRRFRGIEIVGPSDFLADFLPEKDR
jgi:putative PIN family toxin of toxin-antitoxin system